MPLLHYNCPQSATMTCALVFPLCDPTASTFLTTSMPSTTLPNTTCLPSNLQIRNVKNVIPCIHLDLVQQIRYELCSDQAKAKRKATIFFNVCHLFFTLFRLVWIGPYNDDLEKLLIHYHTHQSVFTVHKKNCEPLVLGPALAMDKIPEKRSWT